MGEIQKKYWKIDEIAKECQVTTESIRNWEAEIGMKPKRNYNNERRYNKGQRQYMHRRAKYKTWKTVDFMNYIDELERQL